MSLQSDAVFQKIIDGLKDNAAKAKAVNGVFLYKITKDGKVVKEWSKSLSSIFASANYTSVLAKFKVQANSAYFSPGCYRSSYCCAH